ncbi:MAG: hypothetical protein WC155_01065 [Candidatus Cloacimonadales bacterium]
MNSSFYSGIAVAISLGSLFLNVLFYFLDRKSKMKAEISYGTSVYGGYPLDSYLIIVTNLSNFRKYVQRFEYVVYNRYNIKKKTNIVVHVPLLQNNNEYDKEERKKFYLDIGYLLSQYPIDIKERIRDKWYIRMHVVDSKGKRYKSDKIYLTEISKLESEKKEVPEKLKREFFERMNYGLK